jgi:hypothetical protein
MTIGATRRGSGHSNDLGPAAQAAAGTAHAQSMSQGSHSSSGSSSSSPQSLVASCPGESNVT